MTLQELCDSLAPSFPSSIHKDLKTAVRVLAKALHCPDPQQCSLDQFNQPLPLLYRLVETALIAEGKSAHTIRNTKNNLSRLFRLAAQHQLFSLDPGPLKPRRTFTRKAARAGAVTHNNGTHLAYADWPLPLQEAFTAFATWATDPLVPGRNALFRKRPSSIRTYRRSFAGYFGFLHHIHHLTSLTFEHLFDLTLVTAFVHWHVNELHKRSTITIHIFLNSLIAVAGQYRLLPELKTHLVALRKTLPTPTPVSNKEDAWVSLSTLQTIGRDLWPSKQPHQVRQHSRRPGAHYAARASLSLMLQLWTYIPYRQRNMREMQLGENLHKDVHGQWCITFRGEQLKVARRRGKENCFSLPFPRLLVPRLEEYLQVWRPLLLKYSRSSSPSSAVFLNEFGKPYTQVHLHEKLSRIVYAYTDKHWHPHIVRTVWATEMIREGLNLLDVTEMLNDTLATVVANYAHLLHGDVAEKVYHLIDQRNGQGK
jgi:hypothetical protein